MNKVDSDFLISLCVSKNYKARIEAAKVAADFGKDGMPILEKLAKDGDIDVCLQVAESAVELGKDGLGLLKTLSKDSRWLVREAVADSAGNLGKEGLPLLEQLVNDKDLDVSCAAQEALEIVRKIEKKDNGVKDALEQSVDGAERSKGYCSVKVEER